jgi:hypothetical protein
MEADPLESCTEFRKGSSPSNAPVQSNLPSHPSPPPPIENTIPSPLENTVPKIVCEEDDGELASMANFPVDLTPYLVAGLMVEHGWNRLVTGHVVLGSKPMREHEEHTIVMIQAMATEPEQLQPTLDLVVQFLEESQ